MSTPNDPTPNPTPKPITPMLSAPGPTTLDKILNDFEIAATVIAGVAPAVGPVGATASIFAGLAAKLILSIQAGVKAHEAITGQPLNLDNLHSIDPI